MAIEEDLCLGHDNEDFSDDDSFWLRHSYVDATKEDVTQEVYKTSVSSSKSEVSEEQLQELADYLIYNLVPDNKEKAQSTNTRADADAEAMVLSGDGESEDACNPTQETVKTSPLQEDDKESMASAMKDCGTGDDIDSHNMSYFIEEADEPLEKTNEVSGQEDEPENITNSLHDSFSSIALDISSSNRSADENMQEDTNEQPLSPSASVGSPPSPSNMEDDAVFSNAEEVETTQGSRTFNGGNNTSYHPSYVRMLSCQDSPLQQRGYTIQAMEQSIRQIEEPERCLRKYVLLKSNLFRLRHEYREERKKRKDAATAAASCSAAPSSYLSVQTSSGNTSGSGLSYTNSSCSSSVYNNSGSYQTCGSSVYSPILSSTTLNPPSSLQQHQQQACDTSVTNCHRTAIEACTGALDAMVSSTSDIATSSATPPHILHAMQDAINRVPQPVLDDDLLPPAAKRPRYCEDVDGISEDNKENQTAARAACQASTTASAASSSSSMVMKYDAPYSNNMMYNSSSSTSSSNSSSSGCNTSNNSIGATSSQYSNRNYYSNGISTQNNTVSNPAANMYSSHGMNYMNHGNNYGAMNNYPSYYQQQHQHCHNNNSQYSNINTSSCYPISPAVAMDIDNFTSTTNNPTTVNSNPAGSSATRTYNSPNTDLRSNLDNIIYEIDKQILRENGTSPGPLQSGGCGYPPQQPSYGQSSENSMMDNISLYTDPNTNISDISHFYTNHSYSSSSISNNDNNTVVNNTNSNIVNSNSTNSPDCPYNNNDSSQSFHAYPCGRSSLLSGNNFHSVVYRSLLASLET